METTVAVLAGKVMAGIMPPVVKFAVERTKKTISEVSVRLGSGVENYTRNLLEKISKTKIIINSSVPINLMDIYVNSYLRQNNNVVRDDDISMSCDGIRCHVITGNAGSGKSILMKYLALRCLRDESLLLPICVDLRDLNGESEVDLTSFLFKNFSGFSSYDLEEFLYMLEIGRVAVFLDGFDEVDSDKRSTVAKEIVHFSDKHRKVTVFVSSRPDASFLGWQSFHVFSVCELNDSQIKLLIGKVPYDVSFKNRLLNNIAEGKFKRHDDLLRNPLLLMITLLTTSRVSSVPDKIHLLYDSAFHALFNQHDSAKGGFQRKRLVDLPVDDYQKVFSCFCAISYIKQNFHFLESDLLNIIDKSSKITRISVRKENMLEDLWRCSSMLILDGIHYTFVHRSFQEYFAAYYFMKINPEQIKNVYSRISNKSLSDNVLRMMSEMDSDRFEEFWVLNALIKVKEIINDIDIGNFFYLFSELYGQSSVYIGEADVFRPLYNSGHECSSLLFGLKSCWGGWKKIDQFVEKIGGRTHSERQFISSEVKKRLRAAGKSHHILQLSESDNDWISECRIGRELSVLDSFLESSIGEVRAAIKERARPIDYFE